MRLISVYGVPGACELLYEWLKERSEEQDDFVNISHRGLPTYEQHHAYYHSHPYRVWAFIQVDVLASVAREAVGYISANTQNEIGIILARESRGKGYGSEALDLFKRTYKPLEASAGHRNGSWVANINPRNERSIKMFEKAGFAHVQNTYVLKSE